MARDRFVLAGLARARAPWFRDVAAWSMQASLPAEFVKCVSAEELRALLASGRPFSAVLLDAGLPVTDRDLLAAVREAGAAPIVVDAAGVSRGWRDLGAVAVLPATFERAALLDVLGAYATLVPAEDATPTETDAAPPVEAAEAPLALVCGPGGTGASVSAIALAQGLAADAATAGPVLLADLCRHAEQAMLHDARDVAPGVQELVELHRGGRPGRREVHAQTFRVLERGYHLLLGLRRARYWPSIRPRAFAAALASLRRDFGVVVCDVDADFEGEAEGGSLDVEERNTMARTAAAHAAVAFAVGRGDLKGLHALARVVGDLREAGVPGERIVPVLPGAPRGPKARAGLARALGELTDGACATSPVFLPRRRVEEALIDGVALPAPLPAALAGAFAAALAAAPAEPAPTGGVPERVAPGSLGAWSGPLETETP
ncbi:MAG: hypothetical protein ACQETV_01860 [Actinomycetota bacterium]